MNLKIKLVNAYKALVNKGIELDPSIDDFSIKNLFIEMFNEIPNIYDTDSNILYGPNVKLNLVETIENIDNAIENIEEHVIIKNNHARIYILDNLIFYIYTMNMFNILTLDTYKSIADLPAIIKDNIVKKEIENNPVYHYITQSNNGFTIEDLPIKNININLSENYNDDLPDEEIKEFLNKNGDSGLVILNGKPGTGKSYYLRYLISTIEKEFFVINQMMFRYLNSSAFIKLLIEHKDCIFILEDCEGIIADSGIRSSDLASLLNLSDGLLGDTFNFKFICTFNTSLSNIDQALLRKGRMKIKYEFKELNKEKTQNLAKSLGYDIPVNKEYTLTDIYNYKDISYQKKRSKIGF